jgi:hypothetical protein
MLSTVCYYVAAMWELRLVAEFPDRSPVLISDLDGLDAGETLGCQCRSVSLA